MKRRSIITGAGVITVGSGAILSSGAFSSVETNRTITIQTTGDDAALLQLTDATDGTYVTVTNEMVEIDIGDESAGVNQQARTTFNYLIDIGNNGSQDVTRLTFEIQGDSGEDELLRPIPEAGYGGTGEDFTGDDPSVLTSIDDPVELGLEIELRADVIDTSVAAYDEETGGIDDANFDPTLVITAETDTSA